MFYLIDEYKTIQCISPLEFKSNKGEVVWSDERFLVGEKFKVNKSDKIKVAFITNYNSMCGIASYAQYLTAELSKLVEVIILAEYCDKPLNKDTDNVFRCWNRNSSLDNCVNLINKHSPDIILVNLEWGLYNARHLLKFLQDISSVPVVAVVHSVYKNHKDKNAILATIPNLIVHSNIAKNSLEEVGLLNRIEMIRHGRFPSKKIEKTWPILGSAKKIFSFGFLYEYKSIETIIEAVEEIKKKYKDILFIHLSSNSGKFDNIHSNYYYKLQSLIKEKGLQDNIIILNGYFSDVILETYLLMADVCVFSHKKQEGHFVLGGSGSVSLPLSLGIPTIVSGDTFQFEEFDNILPKPISVKELANEINNVLSNKKYANLLVDKANNYINENSWEIVANRFVSLFKKVLQ